MYGSKIKSRVNKMSRTFNSAPAVIIPPPKITTIPSVPPSPGSFPVPTLTTIPPPSSPIVVIPKSLRSALLSTNSSDALVMKPSTNIGDVLDLSATEKHKDYNGYAGIIADSSLDNELINIGYTPVSKIVIIQENGEKRAQYIKAINKLGQYVFIHIDVQGYATVKSTDLTLVETKKGSIVPYSLKMGAYDCAKKDVCGVTFECGADAICVVERSAHDLTPIEATYIYTDQGVSRSPSLGHVDGSIMSYPLIRLSEIRANHELVLRNTEQVTIRLRESTYDNEVRDLREVHRAIQSLVQAFEQFDNQREKINNKIKASMSELLELNRQHTLETPHTDEDKTNYRMVQYNLAQRNSGTADLLRYMKRVADTKSAIERITLEINDITELSKKEFENYEYVLYE
jgi:hypothetical protein